VVGRRNRRGLLRANYRAALLAELTTSSHCHDPTATLDTTQYCKAPTSASRLPVARSKLHRRHLAGPHGLLHARYPTGPSNWPIARRTAPITRLRCDRIEPPPALSSCHSSVRPSSWLLKFSLRPLPLRYIPSGNIAIPRASGRGARPFGYRSCAGTSRAPRLRRLSICLRERLIHGRPRGHDCPLRASYGTCCGTRGRC
jgi:hypothetical protein